MKNHHLLLTACLAIALTLTWGCTNSGKSGKDGNEIAKDTIPPVPPDPDAMPASTYGSFGLDFLKIGDSLAWRPLYVEGATEIKDTVFTEMVDQGSGPEEVSWLVRRVTLPDGILYLEADFGSSAYLNRVRIETPSYKHFHTGVRVGSTVGELKKLYPELYVRPYPEYGVIEVMPDNHNVFHIENNGKVTDNPKTWVVDNLDEKSKIIRIVIM